MNITKIFIIVLITLSFSLARIAVVYDVNGNHGEVCKRITGDEDGFKVSVDDPNVYKCIGSLSAQYSHVCKGYPVEEGEVTVVQTVKNGEFFIGKLPHEVITLMRVNDYAIMCAQDLENNIVGLFPQKKLEYLDN
jgi:hypothetical protein